MHDLRARLARLALAFTFALWLPAGSLSAQSEDVSILALLPSEGTVEVGSTIQGVLGNQHYLSTAGPRVVAYELEGNTGDPITIDLISDQFDAYLFMAGPGLDGLVQDDDSGGGCNARIGMFLPENGTYRIVVGALNAELGAYTLRVDTRAHPIEESDCSGDPELTQALAGLDPSEDAPEVGSTLSGTLETDDPLLPDGTYARAYRMVLEAGELLVADLTSSAFDAFLALATPDGMVVATDDDGAGACNSRIIHTLEEAGEYFLIVGSVNGGTGPFGLSVSAQPGPVNPAQCSNPY